MTPTIEQAIAARADELQDADMSVSIAAAGVSQALAELRAALDQVDTCLDQREYSEASQLGYGKVASEFIFLQRVLGGLQESVYDIQRLVQEIVIDSDSKSYEEVWPHVKSQLKSMQPRKKRTPEEQAKLRAELKAKLEQIKPGAPRRPMDE